MDQKPHAKRFLRQRPIEFGAGVVVHATRGVPMRLRRAAAHRGRAVDYTMTAVHLGEAIVLHLLEEVFVETTDAIRATSPGQPTIVISAPAADIGYLCPPEAHAEGGMEPPPLPAGPSRWSATPPVNWSAAAAALWLEPTHDCRRISISHPNGDDD